MHTQCCAAAMFNTHFQSFPSDQFMNIKSESLLVQFYTRKIVIELWKLYIVEFYGNLLNLLCAEKVYLTKYFFN